MPEVVVLGGGESGVGAALLAKKQGLSVLVSDYGQIKAQYEKVLIEHKLPYEMGGHSIESFFDAKVIVKSPGIPGNVPVIQQLQQKGISVISEIEFAYRYAQAPIIAITGSNGKTTTTALLHHLLVGAGVNAALGGNIGYSFAALVAQANQPDVYVLEVSSFQLDDIEAFRPHIALLLNITPDHLDRYSQSMDAYALAKFRIAENQRAEDVFIYSAEDPETQVRLDWIAGLAKQERFGLSKGNGRIYEEHLYLDDGWEFPLAQTQLLGPHNQMNMLAALLAVRAWGVDLANIETALASFQPIAHRLEPVRTFEAVQYINDSKATNVDAVKYALAAVSAPIVWLAGGVDKGNDYEALKPLVEEKVKQIIVLGPADEKFRTTFSKPINTVGSMKEAVAIAKQVAQRGDTVLLSPACASFDLFRNYIDRGDQFRIAVNEW